ncbi:hypothetical protein JTE90_008162 [Oedothorax gibbosus]|uniref:Uncharacterized protein n=1 Tax=Oedothorax gibbosus TaxID=931172 RepID=A0AAV6VEH3_9ARAC|nr:hypothetical protein JTE90_008162 [Oedothorax gibbosus]
MDKRTEADDKREVRDERDDCTCAPDDPRYGGGEGISFGGNGKRKLVPLDTYLLEPAISKSSEILGNPCSKHTEFVTARDQVERQDFSSSLSPRGRCSEMERKDDQHPSHPPHHFRFILSLHPHPLPAIERDVGEE